MAGLISEKIQHAAGILAAMDAEAAPGQWRNSYGALHATACDAMILDETRGSLATNITARFQDLYQQSADRDDRQALALYLKGIAGSFHVRAMTNDALHNDILVFFLQQAAKTGLQSEKDTLLVAAEALARIWRFNGNPNNDLLVMAMIEALPPPGETDQFHQILIERLPEDPPVIQAMRLKAETIEAVRVKSRQFHENTRDTVKPPPVFESDFFAQTPQEAILARLTDICAYA